MKNSKENSKENLTQFAVEAANEEIDYLIEGESPSGEPGFGLWQTFQGEFPEASSDDWNLVLEVFKQTIIEIQESKKIELIPTTEDSELYCKYDGQYDRQRVFLTLDLEERTLKADYDANIGGGVSHKSFHGIELNFEIPPLKVKALTDLMQEIEDDCLTILNNSSIEWNGSNYQGELNEEAQEARERIDAHIEASRDLWDYETVWEVWEAGSYFEPTDVVQEYNLKATTTDEELSLKAKEIVEETEGEFNLDQEDVEQYLKGYRDELINLVEEIKCEIEDKFRIEITDEEEKVMRFIVKELESCDNDEDQLTETIQISSLNYAEIEYKHVE